MMKSVIVNTSLLPCLAVAISCGSDVSVIEKTNEPSEEPCDGLVWYADADVDGFGAIDNT